MISSGRCDRSLSKRERDLLRGLAVLEEGVAAEATSVLERCEDAWSLSTQEKREL